MVVLNPLKYHFVCDDLACLDNSERAKTPKPKSRLKLLYLMATGWAYWKDEAFSAHLISICIHLVASFLVFWVFGHNTVSLLAAVLFLLHPASTEISIWMSAKYYGYATILVLLAWDFPILTPLIFLDPARLAVTALFSPLIFLARSDWLSILALFSVWMVYRQSKIIFNPEKNGKLMAYSKNKVAMKTDFWKFIIALKFYGYYLVNNVLGLHYGFYQSYMDDFIDTQEGIKKSHRLDIFFFVGLATITFLIISIRLIQTNLAIFGLFWATIHIAQFCNFINTGQQYISNRYYYLANVGLCLTLASVLIQYPFLAGLAVANYIRQLIPSIRQFENVYWHFFYQIVDEPEFYYSWINMGNLHFNRGHFKEAMGDYQQALILRPNNFKVYFNLSSAWIAIGKIDKAVACLEVARKADVFGQEERATQIIKDRMQLINKIVVSRGELLKTLKTSDVPVVA